MSYKFAKKGCWKILSAFGGIILGILCCPCICMIVQEEKNRNNAPNYRRKRREDRRAKLKNPPNSY